MSYSRLWCRQLVSAVFNRVEPSIPHEVRSLQGKAETSSPQKINNSPLAGLPKRRRSAMVDEERKNPNQPEVDFFAMTGLISPLCCSVSRYSPEAFVLALCLWLWMKWWDQHEPPQRPQRSLWTQLLTRDHIEQKTLPFPTSEEDPTKAGLSQWVWRDAQKQPTHSHNNTIIKYNNKTCRRVYVFFNSFIFVFPHIYCYSISLKICIIPK